MEGTQGGSAGSGQPDEFHVEYRVDVVSPTREALDEIKNKIVERIAKDVRDEQDRIEAREVDEAMTTHDRHMSIHDSG